MGMDRRRRWALAIRLSGTALATASAAEAQVHWDVAAQAGATDRIATGAAPGREPGPSGEIHAHIAVYPMFRVGPYAAFDLSPVAGLPDRQIYAGGLRVKVTPPWLAAPWRAWGFLGIGLAYAYSPSSPSSRSESVTMPEVPIGAGLGHRLHGPWDLYAELGARWNLAGLGGSGSAPAATSSAPTAFVGNDLLAVSLCVGVSLAL
jgi:hypothetical protein